jgi:hypothetical protein
MHIKLSCDRMEIMINTGVGGGLNIKLEFKETGF